MILCVMREVASLPVTKELSSGGLGWGAEVEMRRGGHIDNCLRGNIKNDA